MGNTQQAKLLWLPTYLPMQILGFCGFSSSNLPIYIHIYTYLLVAVSNSVLAFTKVSFHYWFPSCIPIFSLILVVFVEKVRRRGRKQQTTSAKPNIIEYQGRWNMRRKIRVKTKSAVFSQVIMMICRSYIYVCMYVYAVRVGISLLFFLLSFIVYSMQATTRSNFKGTTITNFTFTLLEFRPNIRPSPSLLQPWNLTAVAQKKWISSISTALTFSHLPFHFDFFSW